MSMACTANSIMKPLSMANGCLISSPSIFNPKLTSYPNIISMPFKPTSKLQLSLSCSFSLKMKSNFRTFVAAQQEGDNTIVVEEEEETAWENQETTWENQDTSEATESEGEETVSAALGDAAEDGEEDAGGFPDPPEEAKIYIGNLPYEVDSEKLAQLFEQAGVVEIAEVIYNRETDQSRGFGFVTMSSVEEAEKAVEKFHRYARNRGRSLTVNKAAPRGSRPERTPRENGPSYRVYVGNLPWDFDDAQLEQVFSEHGKVVDARVVYDRESGRSRGFGFVTMSSESEVNDAIENLDGQSFGGRPIRVNVAEQRPRRTFLSLRWHHFFAFEREYNNAVSS